jgi:hypothetical protein
MMAGNGQHVLKIASETLGVPQDDLLVHGLRRYLQSQLHEVQANIFQITGQYNVSNVVEMDARYRDGSLDEASSWRDLQRLDHLEYKRERLQRLLEALP